MTRTLGSIGLGLSALALAPVAQAATPKQVIEARQTSFKAIGRATKAIMDETRRPSPDLAVFRTNAPTLVRLSGELPRWFPRGTGPESRIKTAALPAIWARPADFRTAAANFNAAARALNTAVAGGNAAAITAAARAMGGTCKGCHDNFKADND